MTDSTRAQPLLSRRAVLRGAVLAAIAATLAACQRAISPSGVPTIGAPPTASPIPTASPLPTTVPPPTPSPTPAPTVAAGLTLREKIARMIVVGFRGLTLEASPWVVKAIRDEQLGGVILFDRDGPTGGSRNIESPSQVRHLVADLKALAPRRELIVAIDQEGGLVTRLSTKYGFPPLASEQTIGEKSKATVGAWADGLVGTLSDMGISLNFAPVVDVNVNPDNPAIGALGRSFSADPNIVARDAAIEVAAHRKKGIRTALKHFPGLGSATVNTDFGVSDVTTTWSDDELDPYRSLIDSGLVDLVMAAHVINGRIDPDTPASLSPATITDLLRGQLGFDGPVVTDDMQAVAITDAFGDDDAVRLAIEAGCDLLLFANQSVYKPARFGQVVDLVEGLVRDGTFTEARIDASVARLERLFPSR
ncbi:MAG TPA: glycoside hydrolase family 3 N-terminal domain-containing protein [Candidatus Limnocylindrales bacterium]|nr:glycoside hydrolase family 3 N-terminal domain-containing protein [Candidatus Limnocylindrales bacterium]